MSRREAISRLVGQIRERPLTRLPSAMLLTADDGATRVTLRTVEFGRLLDQMLTTEGVGGAPIRTHEMCPTHSSVSQATGASSCEASTSMAELPDAIETIRPSVVQIVTGASIGSGFIARSDGVVVTAAHVVSPTAVGGQLSIRLAMPSLTGTVTIRGSFEQLTGEVVDIDSVHDLAFVKLVNNPYRSGKTPGITADIGGGLAINALYGVAQLDEVPVRDGERVAVTGYPLGEPALVTTSGGIASAFGFDILAEAGVDPAELTLPLPPPIVPAITDSYLADVAVNPGNSGGPVFRVPSAGVIGVCVAYRGAPIGGSSATPFDLNSGLAIVVPIKYALQRLTNIAP